MADAPPRQETSHDVKHKACDQCKKRKVRCSGRQPCQNCLRAKEQCSFSSPHGRLANAERRANRAIERASLLEIAWNHYLPQVPLDSALVAIKEQKHLDFTVSEPTTTKPTPEDPKPFGYAPTPANFEHAVSSSSEGDSEHVCEHERADSLEWDESADLVSIADGIGSLSVQSQGVGYMGPQSGIALLRSLQSFSGSALLREDESSSYWASSSHLSEQELKSSALIGKCVDAYFKHYHCAYPIMHEGQFRAQLMGTLTGALPKPKDGSWPILYNVVLAIGAHSGTFSRQNADHYYYQQACRYLSWDILRRGSLSLVQALALMANYLQKRNRPNSGFTMLGVAMNMAQGIGLHREFADPSISPHAMEVRRRVWWTLFIFDSGARVTFGRPTLTMGGINVALPRNLDDSDLAVDIEELPSPKDHATISSSLISQTKLARIGNLANEELLKSGPPSEAVLSGFGKRVQDWRDKLPPYMKEGSSASDHEDFEIPRMVLLWRSMHLRIVIFRPFILDAIRRRAHFRFEDPQSPHIQCVNAASECVASITSFWTFTDSHPGALVWYACYWLVTAVFVHMTCLLYAPEHLSAFDWRQHIELSKTSLEDMAPAEPTAARAIRVINQLLSLVPSSPDSNFLESNEPLRMEVAEFWNQGWNDFSIFQPMSPMNLPPPGP